MHVKILNSRKKKENISKQKTTSFNFGNIYDVQSQNNVNHENLEKWPKDTVAVIGDSMLSGSDEKRLSKGEKNVKVFCYPGAKIKDIKYHAIPILNKKPSTIILHVGTNNAVQSTSREIINDLLNLKHHLSTQLKGCRIIISEPTYRSDNGKACLTIHKVIEHLSQLKIDTMCNKNINSDHIGRKGLHLNTKGTVRLAMNLISTIHRL